MSVARPAKWGNPFAVGVMAGPPYSGKMRLVCDRADAVALFTSYIKGISHELIRSELGGKSLACWCPPPAGGQPDICHAAVLLKVASEWSLPC